MYVHPWSSPSFVSNTLSGHSRFIHNHGQHTARVDAYGDIHNLKTAQRSQPILFGVVSMLLFDLPHTRMIELEKTYMNSVVRLNMWRSMIHNIEKDWNKSLVPVSFLECYSHLEADPKIQVTVLLVANIGFLSAATANQIASIIICVSAIFCLASVITSCVLKHNFSTTIFISSPEIVCLLYLISR